MKAINNRSTALSAAISLSFCAAVQAAPSVPLTPVVVTANRLAVPLDEALASVTVLTRQDIEQSQSPDLIGLLGRQAGIDIARSGGPGQASTVFMRGSNSNHTLVLVDGIRVNAASQGIIDFAHVPLAQVERIEIVRGPRAALWGSDAIGGVIQIFTRDPSQAFFEARLGSYGRAGATAGVGGEFGDSRVGIAAGGERLRGFSATNARAFGFDPDQDGYRNQNLGLHGQTAIGSQSLVFSGLLTDADVEFDAGAAPGEGKTAALNRVFGLTLAGPVSDRWSHSLVLGRSSEDLATPVYFSRFGSARTSLDWINTVTLGTDHSFNVGLNWSRESAYSDEGFSGYDQSRRNAALFGAWRGRFGPHTVELSARHDDNSQFDSASTGNAAWGWQVSQAVRLRASWGQGFRAPNFNELYYPGFGGLFEGNSRLRPEHSTSTELGLDWRVTPEQQLGVSLYRTRIADLIAFDGPLFGAINIDRAAIDGVELQYSLERGALRVDGNATWQHARKLEVLGDQPLLRRPDRKANLSMGYRFDNRVLLAVDGSAVSRRPDFGGVELPGYGRIDVRVSAPLHAGWSVEARLENLGDRQYSLVDGYNTPGRSGLFSLRWNAR